MVTTQLSLLAAMIAALGLTGTEEVLEIGTGYGYQTALLAPLAARVVSIDIWPDLAAQARRNLAAQGACNVVVLTGDGTDGVQDCPVRCDRGLRRLPSCAAAAGRPAQDRGRQVQPVGPGAQNMSFRTRRSRRAAGMPRTVGAGRPGWHVTEPQWTTGR